jgi:hypothetical protein
VASPDESQSLSKRCKAAILAALDELGGSARRDAICALARERGVFTDEERAAPAPEKAQGKYVDLLSHQLSWALTHLKRDGLLENPRWGEWRLTEASGVTASPLAEPVPENRLAALRAMPYRDYLRTDEWRQTRAAALARAEHRCQLDASHTGPFHVHHSSYERRGTELEADVIVLCESCHNLHHRVNGRPGQAPDLPTASERRSMEGSVPPPSVSDPVEALRRSDENAAGSRWARLRALFG